MEPKCHVFLLLLLFLLSILSSLCQSRILLFTWSFRLLKTFLLHIGCNGLKCPLLAQKALIGLIKGLFIPKAAFLESFFTTKLHFAIDNHVLRSGKSLMVSNWIIFAEKSLFRVF
jgi:hypothetical protein